MATSSNDKFNNEKIPTKNHVVVMQERIVYLLGNYKFGDYKGTTEELATQIIAEVLAFEGFNEVKRNINEMRYLMQKIIDKYNIDIDKVNKS